MSMMSAMQCNPVFKATYQRIIAAGNRKISHHSVRENDGSDLKFDGEGWCLLGSKNELKLGFDTIVTCTLPPNYRRTYYIEQNKAVE